MGNINNCIRASLKLQGYFGREADMLLAWAIDGGAKSKDVDEALLELLHLNGARSNDLETAWLEIYHKLGLCGSSREMEVAFWLDHLGTFPLGVVVGWTGKEYCNHEQDDTYAFI